MFSIGDIVYTDFDPRLSKVSRTVTYVETGQICQTGVIVTTVDSRGQTLRCDAGWYQNKPI